MGEKTRKQRKNMLIHHIMLPYARMQVNKPKRAITKTENKQKRGKYNRREGAREKLDDKKQSNQAKVTEETIATKTEKQIKMTCCRVL